MMENHRKKLPNKLKSVNASQQTSLSSNAFGYKHFKSASGKRRKNRKKYFEHDTRTHTIRTATVASPSNVGTPAAIKKIKFNNEIRIFQTKMDNGTSAAVNKHVLKKKLIKDQKKRSFRMRHQNGKIQANNIQFTTKKLQMQLIETQKQLQMQLNALQKHQREQNNSLIAMFHSNCMHTLSSSSSSSSASVKRNDDEDNVCDDDGGGDDGGNDNNHTNHQHPHSNVLSHLKSTQCSEPFYKCFTDQSKCSIDKMANGNKATNIRAFACETKSKNCSVSTDPESYAIKSSNVDLCNYHHCSSCHSYAKNLPKRSKIYIKKPLLKSIILNTNQKNTLTSLAALNIKREIDEFTECNKEFTKESAIDTADICLAVKQPKLNNTIMQFSDIKKTKQINSYFKSNDFVQQNERSYSPPLPVTHRLASTVSNDIKTTNNNNNSNNNNNNNNNKNNNNNNNNNKNNNNNRNHSRRSHSFKDHKSSKRRKKRKRPHSRESRSRSRSYSRSQSSSRSRSPSRSQSHRHRSSRSRSSSSDNSGRHHSPDRKMKSHFKNRNVFRRSSKRDERNCGCNCNCINYCKKSSKHFMSIQKSKSPSNDSTFSLKQNNISTSSLNKCINKRSITSTITDTNGSSTFKKKPITINSGVLLKQQPIVKLHSSPATGSDTDNEIDDKFDRKYEELLTFETNEDERREQRLLKALSDIAAKAKQKIQSISDPNVAKSMHDIRNDRSIISKTNKSLKYNSMNKKLSNDICDERRRSERQPSDDNEYSPHERKHPKRASSKRSRRDSSNSSSTSSKEEKSPRSSRSPSIPRRRGSPSFLDRRRITSARKKPIPYKRSSPYDSLDEWDSS